MKFFYVLFCVLLFFRSDFVLSQSYETSQKRKMEQYIEIGSGDFTVDSSTIFNESGADADFRIESDTLINAFFMEGSNGNLGVGTAVPTEKIETYTTTGNGNLIRMHTAAVAEYKIGIPSGSTDLYLTNSSGAAAGTTTTKGILIDTSGEVGLGLTPQTKLNLLSSSSSTYTDGILFGTASNTTHGLGIWYNNNGATTAYIDSRIDSDTSKIQIRTKTDGTAVNALTVLGNGKVGLNTLLPLGLFHSSNGIPTSFTPDAGADEGVFSGSGSEAGVTIASTTTGALNFGTAGVGNGRKGRIQYNFPNNEMRLFTNDLQRLTVDSSGAIGIGDSPNNVGSHSTLLDIVGGSRSALQIRGTEATNVNGAIQFYEGTTLQSAIQNRSTGTGKLEFTTGDGGFLFFGDITVQNGNSSLGLAYVSQDASGNEWHFGRNNGDGNFDIVRQTGTGVTLVTNSWAATSDERLKKDIIEYTGGLSVVKKINVREFAWKKTDEKEIGFIAQELMNVFPDAVYGDPKSTVDTPMSVSKTKLIPVLTKAIQEQQEIIEMQKQWICSQADAPQALCN